jgi:hypothetical protein
MKALKFPVCSVLMRFNKEVISGNEKLVAAKREGCTNGR